jgi:hypothetical protein
LNNVSKVHTLDVSWTIDPSGTNGSLTLQQAWSMIQSNVVNNTAYHLYLSPGAHVATRNFSLEFSTYWNISIRYVGNATSEADGAFISKGLSPYPVWMRYKRMNGVSFSGVQLNNCVISVKSCDAFSVESVTLQGNQITFHCMYYATIDPEPFRYHHQKFTRRSLWKRQQPYSETSSPKVRRQSVYLMVTSFSFTRRSEPFHDNVVQIDVAQLSTNNGDLEL